MMARCLLGLLFVVVAVNAETMTTGDVQIDIVGRSGKMKLWRTTTDDTDNNKIFVEMDSLKEVDASGNEVGTSGNTKHSFNSFASQDFTFSAITDAQLAGSKDNEDEDNNDEIDVKKISFEASLGGLSSKLKVFMYILKQGGEIDVGGEKSEVQEGQVKFSLDLSDWEWCGCTKGGTTEIGAFIDFTLAIKPTGGGSVKEESGRSFGLGGDSEISFSKKVQVDGGSWVDMPTGFPKYEEQGSKHKFTFRFPKFTSAALYDPTIKLGGGSNAVIASLTLMLTSLIFGKLLC